MGYLQSDKVNGKQVKSNTSHWSPPLPAEKGIVSSGPERPQTPVVDHPAFDHRTPGGPIRNIHNPDTGKPAPKQNVS